MFRKGTTEGIVPPGVEEIVNRYVLPGTKEELAVYKKRCNSKAYHTEKNRRERELGMPAED